MRQLGAILTAITLATLGTASEAQERQPFHVAEFPDNRIISLAILMSEASADLQFDYDVEVELTEQDPGGQTIFADYGHHLVRVRCTAPKAVKVGSVLYKLETPAVADDWKGDLWKTLCFQPVS
ncbi:hypothetical protein GB927_025295 [Shinella sp. CPCC 100929]|jgi:hypothetical protein|uniref:Lipoprotein n=1 Tax=Shinella lacus TaxID=2654216 RepID=A0ABT1RDW8_9HYPH|nr:hypothetical protein [Shinella lacus]MCQ4633380.1 hypothetical protein [Shinella lacus]